jgi:hypothetical protein
MRCYDCRADRRRCGLTGRLNRPRRLFRSRRQNRRVARNGLRELRPAGRTRRAPRQRLVCVGMLRIWICTQTTPAGEGVTVVLRLTGTLSPGASKIADGHQRRLYQCSFCGISRSSEAALSVLFADDSKLRVYFNEVHVQTFVPSTIFAKAIAFEIFKVDSPAVFVRRVGCEVMLGFRRPLADSSDVMSDLNRQIVYMTRIPRSLFVCGAGSGRSWEFTAKQKGKAQQ